MKLIAKRKIRKMRKTWKRAVDKTLAEDNESKTITDATRELLMGLFDDFVSDSCKR